MGRNHIQFHQNQTPQQIQVKLGLVHQEEDEILCLDLLTPVKFNMDAEKMICKTGKDLSSHVRTEFQMIINS